MDSVSIRYLIANSNLGRNTVYKHVDMLKLFGLVSVKYEFDKSANKEIMVVSVKDMYNLLYLPILGKTDFDVLLKSIDEYRVKHGLPMVFKYIKNL